MILGYILICGFGPLEPGSIEGCKTLTMQWSTMDLCQEARMSYIENAGLPNSLFIDDSGCIVIGTGV